RAHRAQRDSPPQGAPGCHAPGRLGGGRDRGIGLQPSHSGCTRMPRFQHGSVEIAFLDQGEGEPIVLVHGFASNARVNWVQPGWVTTLTRAGRRAIALDVRGHGESSKLYDPADYHTTKMAQDVAALIDHLGLDRTDLMGYSMGSRIVAFLAAQQPERARSL